MNVLVVDIGGTHVKVLASDQTESRQFNSGPALLPKPMTLGAQKIAAGWSYDVVSIGYPGPALRNWPIAEPHNLGHGWVGFDLKPPSDIP
jgi:polyphosphate glucokinase